MIMLLSLTACTSVPTVQPKVLQVCPKVPMLELDLPPGVLEHSFTNRMQLFLQGKLLEPISYELRSTPASKPTIKLDAK
jgi:hypothetical protein